MVTATVILQVATGYSGSVLGVKMCVQVWLLQVCSVHLHAQACNLGNHHNETGMTHCVCNQLCKPPGLQANLLYAL